MSVVRYRVSMLDLNKCPLRIQPQELLSILKAWRKKNSFATACSNCNKKIEFGSRNFGLCCGQFYFQEQQTCYFLQSIAIPTPGYTFVLPQHERAMHQAGIECNQDFLVIPDPIYWQLSTTLIYDKVARFVSNEPMTRRTKTVQPPSKSAAFYKQIQEAPLNYGSLDSRSCGKATFIRQLAFGKRCLYSMRGMIVPDATLRPNEIRLPDFIVKKFGVKGKWVVLNRMPSLQPENFVALRVPDDGWPYDCFGIPLEILSSINGDFDGDEVNIYLFSSVLAQAECATLLNPEWEMGSSVMEMKLSPCQDMLVAYHLFYDKISFLPYKNPDLKKTFRVIFEIFGSKRAFQAFDDMRNFYLYTFENEKVFSLTLEEMNWLVDRYAKNGGQVVQYGKGCLVTQILANAKGNFELLKQMFGEIGMQSGTEIKNSFWSGLTPLESVAHAKASHVALWQTSKIWQPGYGHNKIIFNLQGLCVDYLGRVVDGTNRIVERDVLDAIHHTDAMSEETFDYILDQVLVLKNFEMASID